jgi:hypothetical protein
MKKNTWMFLVLILIFLPACGSSGGGDDEGQTEGTIEYVFDKTMIGVSIDENYPQNGVQGENTTFSSSQQIVFFFNLTKISGGIPGFKLECQREDGLLYPEISQPEYHSDWGVKDDGYQKWFILNLPSGNYEVRFYIEKGDGNFDKVDVKNIIVKPPIQTYTFKTEDVIVLGTGAEKDCTDCVGYHIVGSKTSFNSGENIYALTNGYDINLEWSKLSHDWEKAGVVFFSSNDIPANQPLILQGGILDKYSHYSIQNLTPGNDYSVAVYLQDSLTGQRKLITRINFVVAGNSSGSFDYAGSVFCTKIVMEENNLYHAEGIANTFSAGTEVFNFVTLSDISTNFLQFKQEWYSSTNSLMYVSTSNVFRPTSVWAHLYQWSSQIPLTPGIYKVINFVKSEENGSFKKMEEISYTVTSVSNGG